MSADRQRLALIFRLNGCTSVFRECVKSLRMEGDLGMCNEIETQVDLVEKELSEIHSATIDKMDK